MRLLHPIFLSLLLITLVCIILPGCENPETGFIENEFYIVTIGEDDLMIVDKRDYRKVYLRDIGLTVFEEAEAGGVVSIKFNHNGSIEKIIVPDTLKDLISFSKGPMRE